VGEKFVKMVVGSKNILDGFQREFYFLKGSGERAFSPNECDSLQEHLITSAMK
jgi:hypothetical protein